MCVTIAVTDPGLYCCLLSIMSIPASLLPPPRFKVNDLYFEGQYPLEVSAFWQGWFHCRLIARSERKQLALRALLSRPTPHV